MGAPKIPDGVETGILIDRLKACISDAYEKAHHIHKRDTSKREMAAALEDIATELRAEEFNLEKLRQIILQLKECAEYWRTAAYELEERIAAFN